MGPDGGLGKRLGGPRAIVIALGSNRPGGWGPPAQSLRRACRELRASGLDLKGASRIYTTAPLGPDQNAPYANAVVIVHSHLAPPALLRRLHAIERRAGRRSAMPWGPRPLDLDIVDYKGLVWNWTPQGPLRRRTRGRGRLILPHAEAHLRPFVMIPLAELAPGWRHPVLKRTARQLAEALRQQRAGGILASAGWLDEAEPASGLASTPASA